jgi:hypothetical protein
VRDHAKASSAGSNQRRAKGLGRLAIGALPVILALLLLAPFAQAKEVVGFFGTESGSGSFGGEFDFGSQSGEIAVNNTGKGAPQGTIYVADAKNHRIQRFSPNGDFEAAWGKDVIAALVNERQRLKIEASGGTYQLTVNGVTTAPIVFDASVEAFKAANTLDDVLDGLSSVGGDANVAVSSDGVGSFKITFQGALAGTDLPQITANTGQLAGTAKVTTLADGASTTSDTGTGFEVCTIAVQCKAGVASGGDGTAAGNGSLDNPQSVAVDSDTGFVYVSDRDNRRINAYDGEGDFLFSIGRDVAEPDGGTAVEVCDGETETCREGDVGLGAGELGSGGTPGTFGIAVSPPDGQASVGKVFLADSGNRRINSYDLDGANPASFGSASDFGTTQPRKIAVDSRGIVYATDSEGGGEVERYDTEDANGGGVGFLAPIPAAINEWQLLDGLHFGGSHVILTCPDGTVIPSTEVIQGENGNKLAEIIEKTLETHCGAPGDFEVGANNFDVDNEPEIGVAFKGNLAATNLNQMQCTIVEGGTCTVTTVANGKSGTLLPVGSNSDSIAIATTGLAVDPDEDVLYVLRRHVAGPDAVQQFGPDNDPGLATAPSEDDNRHGGGFGFQSVFGLGLDYITDRLFVTSSEGRVGIGSGDRVYVIGDPLPAPVPFINPVTAETDSTADFSATVDPKGGLITCTFQYARNSAFSSPHEIGAPGCGAFDPQGGYQGVDARATDLEPNTRYFVRVRATRTFDSSDTVTSGFTEFTTDAVPPAITDVGAVQVQDTSARLVATINPRNSDTGYVFQYGTTPAFGSSTGPVAIGGGNEAITVSQVVGGLGKDTEYYFRLVATNGVGTTNSAASSFHTRTLPFPRDPVSCPNDAIREAQGSAYLPECRAYEMVTPLEKNYTDADNVAGFLRDGTAGVSLDGEAVGFCTTALFGEPSGQMPFICAAYLSRRGAGGWLTENPFPSYCHIEPLSGNTQGAQTIYPSADFSTFAVRAPESAGCPIEPLDPAAPLIPGKHSYNLYRGDLSIDPPDYDLLSPQPGGRGFGVIVYGGNDDFSHIVYGSDNNQTLPPDSPALGQPGGDDFEKIYEEHDGTLRLVSKDPGGAPFTTPSAPPGIPPNGGVATRPNPDTVSADGERIYFANPSNGSTHGCSIPSCELYMREGGVQTFQVSASECTSSCGPNFADLFDSATPSGDIAFFRTCAKLTDASSPASDCSVDPEFKLYRWDRNAPPGSRLVDLTVDNELADGDDPGIAYHSLIGHSDDGNTVYFVTRGQIVAGEPTFPETGGSLHVKGGKLYRWRWNGGSPTVDYLGPYNAVDGGIDFNVEINTDRQRKHVSPDGKYLLIYTDLRYDAAGDRDSDTDAYRWDEGSGWLCVSCQLPGEPSRGDVDRREVWLNDSTEFYMEISSTEPRYFMSEDGQRIFFGTPDALVPEDTNAEAGCPPIEYGGSNLISSTIPACMDVYEWHDGHVSLISSGSDTGPARLMFATATGRDVFYYTRQRLVGWDADESIDIYDVRIGGGFPEPPAAPPACEGEACRGAGTVTPVTPGAGTAAFQGPGSPTSQTPPRCPKGKRKVVRKGKARCVTSKRKRQNRAAKRNRRTAR